MGADIYVYVYEFIFFHFLQKRQGMDIRLSSFEEMGHVALMIVLIFFDLTL